MQTVDYRLQKEIQNIKLDSQEWFKNYLREVLESNKPYYAKADYIGLSIKEIEKKIFYLSEDIKEMQNIKKKLSEAKTLAIEICAEMFREYGIDKLDGTLISSLTITPQKTKVQEALSILDEEALIQLGYFKAVVDEDAVKEAMQILESMDEIDRYVQIKVDKEIIPARIKVNTRRNNTNNQASELLNLVDSQEAA